MKPKEVEKGIALGSRTLYPRRYNVLVLLFSFFVLVVLFVSRAIAA